jgi:pyruvate dehydrogenase (quinone)
MPPHITLEQAKAFTSSVLKGDVDRLGFLKQTAKEVADRYLPHRK